MGSSHMRAVQGSWIRFAVCSVVLSASLAACGGGGGGSTAAQTSTGTPNTPATPSSSAPNTAPQISGTAPSAVVAGQTYSFTPVATDVDKDTVTFTIANKPAWLSFNAATGLLSGTAPAAAGTFAGIEIAATDGEAVTPLPAFTITVNPAGAVGNSNVSLAWTPPTQNDDGSTLTDLSGYKIHYGTESGNYSQTVDVQNPGLSRFDLSSLPQGKLFIAMTSVNASGAQSEFSPEVSVTVN
jgi:hypothetical protein